jgi:hypothetical protein
LRGVRRDQRLRTLAGRSKHLGNVRNEDARQRRSNGIRNRAIPLRFDPGKLKYRRPVGLIGAYKAPHLAGRKSTRRV